MCLCDEDARNLILLEVKNMKEVLEMYDSIIGIIKKFDGKVLNKRLETALKSVSNSLYVDTKFSFNIEFYCFDRGCRSANSDSWIYITKNSIVLNNFLSLNSSNPNNKNTAVDENNRIIADTIIKSLNGGKEYLERQVDRYTDGLGKVEEWRNRMDKIVNDMYELKKEIPSAFRDYFYGFNKSIIR